MVEFILHFEYIKPVGDEQDLDRLTDFERSLHDEDHRHGGLRRCDHENIVRLWRGFVEDALADQ